MKIKNVKFLLFSLIGVLCFTVLFINLNNDIEKQRNQTLFSVEQDYYTVKEYEGKVAVFKNSDTAPTTVYESYVSLLPEQDRLRLSQGIRVDSTEELQKIIEDYTS